MNLHRSIIGLKIILPAVCFYVSGTLAAEQPLPLENPLPEQQAVYIADFEKAKAEAKRLDRRVILYTGRAQFCAGNDPKKHFFDKIVTSMPSLQGSLSRFVICKYFMYPDIFTKNGAVNPAFSEEMNRGFYALHEKYDLRFFYPMITVVDGNGDKIAGPFGGGHGNLEEAKAFFTTK